MGGEAHVERGATSLALIVREGPSISRDCFCACSSQVQVQVAAALTNLGPGTRCGWFVTRRCRTRSLSVCAVSLSGCG